MARSRGFPLRQFPTSKRQTAWASGPEAVALSLAASGKAIWTFGVALLAGGDKATIVRTRGFGRVHLRGSAGGITDGFAGAVGLAIVPSTAFAIGVTAIPGPLTEEDWDGWLWHEFFDIRTTTSVTADLGEQVIASKAFVIDSKAMRKISGDETVVGMLEATETGVEALAFNARCRMLVKLS